MGYTKPIVPRPRSGRLLPMAHVQLMPSFPQSHHRHLYLLASTPVNLARTRPSRKVSTAVDFAQSLVTKLSCCISLKLPRSHAICVLQPHLPASPHMDRMLVCLILGLTHQLRGMEPVNLWKLLSSEHTRSHPELHTSQSNASGLSIVAPAKLVPPLLVLFSPYHQRVC
jgi:hypothetical protein